MNLYTEKITESRNQVTDINLKDFENYINKVEPKLRRSHQQVLLIMKLLFQYCIVSKEEVDTIINGNKSALKTLSIEYNVPVMELIDLQKSLKTIKGDIRLLPMYLSEQERNDFMSGNKTADDIVLDLESEKGRNEVARKYAYIVTAVARKYMGKSGLDWNGLISAGMEGLTLAMNDYHKNDDRVDAETNNDDKAETKKQKHLSFDQYAWYRVRQKVLYDMNNLSRTVKINQHEYEKNKAAGNTKGNFNTISIDQSFDSEGDSMLDRRKEISVDADADKTQDNGQWDIIYKEIEKKFDTRPAIIFYKYFGLNGYDREKGIEIAKEFNIVPAYVSTLVRKITKWLQENKKTKHLLQELFDIYSEGFVVDYLNNIDQVNEAMIQDDIYVWLNEMTRFDNKNVLNNAIGNALDMFDESERTFVIQCLENNFDFVDNGYNSHKRTIVRFLESLYPTESIKKKSDVLILCMMEEIVESFKTQNHI